MTRSGLGKGIRILQIRRSSGCTTLFGSSFAHEIRLGEMLPGFPFALDGIVQLPLRDHRFTFDQEDTSIVLQIYWSQYCIRHQSMPFRIEKTGKNDALKRGVSRITPQFRAQASHVEESEAFHFLFGTASEPSLRGVLFCFDAASRTKSRVAFVRSLSTSPET